MKWTKQLSLQEKKVINGLERYKIPAYIGYRRSFKDGKNRVGLNDKPVFALLEIASACNIKCPFCFQSDPSFTTEDYMGIIDTNLAFKVVDEIDKSCLAIPAAGNRFLEFPSFRLWWCM